MVPSWSVRRARRCPSGCARPRPCLGPMSREGGCAPQAEFSLPAWPSESLLQTLGARLSQHGHRASQPTRGTPGRQTAAPVRRLWGSHQVTPGRFPSQLLLTLYVPPRGRGLQESRDRPSALLPGATRRLLSSRSVSSEGGSRSAPPPSRPARAPLLAPSFPRPSLSCPPASCPRPRLRRTPAGASSTAPCPSRTASSHRSPPAAGAPLRSTARPLPAGGPSAERGSPPAAGGPCAEHSSGAQRPVSSSAPPA